MSNPEYRKAILDNGVILVAERHPYVRSVCIGVWVKIGSSFESPSQSGISHFIEHMVFKGTETRTPLQIATVLESLGGDLNAFTDREFTCYHATVLSEHVDIALDILSDLVTAPTFPKNEIERERKVLLQEMSMIEDVPDEWIVDIFFQTVWKGEPLGQSVIGSKKTVQRISRQQLIRFFQEHYTAENIVVSVAGNVDFEDLRARCEHYFGKMPSKKTLSLTRMASSYHPRKKTVLSNSEQLHLIVGYEGVSFKDPQRFHALILSFFLGGGMSSRLFQEIREKAGLAYSVDCDCVPFFDSGVLSIYAAMLPRSLKQGMGIISREIRKLKEVKLVDGDLELVKGQLKGAILLSSDQMETRQESLGRNEVVFGRYVPVEEVIEEIARVTPGDLCEVAKRIFVHEKESVITLGKMKPKAALLTVC